MEQSLRLQILRALARDRQFAKSSWRDLSPDDFPEPEEKIVAQAALDFYEKNEDIIGPLLRSDADDLAIQKRLSINQRKKLVSLLDTIQQQKLELVSAKALEDRVKKLKQHAFYESSVEKVITAHEQGKLNANVFGEIVEEAAKRLASVSVHSRDYFTELEKRIARRANWDANKAPMLFVDKLDEKMESISRGQLGILLAPPGGGKGIGLLHIAVAYAFQGFKVVHISLEDPPELVDSRLDASLTGLPLQRLRALPNNLRKRFKVVRSKMRGRIRLVDGTNETWTVTAFERLVENLKKEDFDPDVVVIDYDDEVECEKQFKGESAKRFEILEIYKRFRKFAAKADIFLWTAAQTTRAGEGKKIITGKDTAEGYDKIRKAFLAIGIGSDPSREDVRFLYVLKNRSGRAHFVVEIKSDYESALFYNRSASLALNGASQNGNSTRPTNPSDPKKKRHPL